MAERPIFIPEKDAAGFVREMSFSIPWASGFAPVQKKKNIAALHDAAARKGFSPLLEVSTKSDVVAGQRLSAFHLKVQSEIGQISLECAYQGSKVFQNGGPYTDLYEVDPREAKRDLRLTNSGYLIRFEFEGTKFPLQPTSVFYDWLYLTAIYPHKDWLEWRIASEECTYVGFTDIEFNPNKSLNCQARSCALFVSLLKSNLLDDAMRSPETFIATMKEHARPRIGKETERQLSL